MFKKFKGRIKNIFFGIKRQKIPSKTVVLIRKRPLISFFLSFGVLLLLIVLGNLLKAPARETPELNIVKDVTVLSLGFPSVNVSGQVRKYGILQISAQSTGIVSKVSVSEGDLVKKGKNLVSLSSNYQGGIAPSVSRQIAQKQYENTRDSFDSQKDIINRQKEIAEQTSTQTEELRKIAEKSNEDSNNLLNLNQEILNKVNDNLTNLEQNNQGGVNDALILQTKQTRAALQQSVNLLKVSIRSADFSNNTDNTPTKLSNLNKDITLKQLEYQEKTLVLNKEVSKLQLSLAAISEAFMFPVSPCNGIVQKVNVAVSEQVNPGNPMIIVACDDREVKVITKVPGEIAKSTTNLMESKLIMNGQQIYLLPDFISSEATDGQLYQIVFTLPDGISETLTDGSFISIEVPIAQSVKDKFFVPIDSVFQTHEAAFVYIVDGEHATTKKVSLGSVLGSDVEITEGLSIEDKIIINRNVVSGDKVKVMNE